MATKTAPPIEIDRQTNTATLEQHRDDRAKPTPALPGDWKSFFADDSLVLPADFAPPEDPKPDDRDL
jgi:hypothetical protein